LLTIGLVLLAAAPEAATDPQAAITAAMEASAAGWNDGDMARFLNVYAGDAVFVTKDGLVRGKAAIAARYDRNYGPDTAKRGRLSFRMLGFRRVDATHQMLGFRRVDATHQMLWARWTLDYPASKQVGGMTSLLFERQADGWKIVSDHSS
jgi:ketosteroid isomerase-like protein